MVHFVPLALTALFASANAKQNLRYPSFSHAVERHLSQQLIAGFAPETAVTDHNAIDLDQKVIVEQVGKKTDSSFLLAKAVYEKGGHSKSYAKLTLDNSDTAITVGDKKVFEGKDASNQDVVGKVYKSSSFNTGELWLQYQTSEKQEDWVGCRVGGGALVDTGDHYTEGCFAPSGSVTYQGTSYPYTYDVEKDNHNGRTIQGFSLQVQSKMLSCAKCPYPDAKYFSDYYGAPDYGDIWVQAALSGTRTDFPSSKGNADFASYGFDGRAECVKKGTAYMNVFMYVIREFEDALDDCQKTCTIAGCNDDPVHAWDEGVAFYAGSLEGLYGDGSGELLHALADKRCANYDTCIDEEKKKSKVNDDLLNLFNLGSGQLIRGKCDEARDTKNKIADIMYIPMIQGTIRYANKVENLQGGEKEKAEGAVFAASVLPRIHAADPKAADIIYENMRVGAPTTSFSKVKKAFESVYKDLNIKCSDVGGLIDKTGAYYSGAKPCSDGTSTANVLGIVFGVLAGVIAIGAASFFLVMRKREREGRPIFAPVKPGKDGFQDEGPI